jgi:hypothetical protein
LADVLAGNDPDAAQAASTAHVYHDIEEIVAGIKLARATPEPKSRLGRAAASAASK